MGEPFSEVLHRAENDLAGAGFEQAFCMYSLSSNGFVYGSAAGVAAPVGFGQLGYVLIAFGSQTLIDDLRDGDQEHPEALLVDTMSLLQDHVIDQLGAGWPEQRDDGGTARILLPALISGRAAWTAHGRRVTAIGELYS